MRPIRKTATIVMAISCLVMAVANYGDVHWASTASQMFVAVVALAALPWIKN